MTERSLCLSEDGRLSVLYIAEECLKKLDTKQQTNTLLSLVWEGLGPARRLTLMAAICHTLMVQHRALVLAGQASGHTPCQWRPASALVGAQAARAR